MFSKTQEKEAKQKMLERAEEIRRMKVQAEKGGQKSSSSSSHFSSGFGSSSSSSSSGAYSGKRDEPSAFETAPPPSFSSSSNSSKPNRAMKLGTSKDVMPAFIEQQVKQSLPASQQASSSVGSTSTAAVVSQEKFVPKIQIKFATHLLN